VAPGAAGELLSDDVFYFQIPIRSFLNLPVVETPWPFRKNRTRPICSDPRAAGRFLQWGIHPFISMRVDVFLWGLGAGMHGIAMASASTQAKNRRACVGRSFDSLRNKKLIEINPDELWPALQSMDFILLFRDVEHGR
jgi:hypothetical protein